jgi:sialic acid synthase SpsE
LNTSLHSTAVPEFSRLFAIGGRQVGAGAACFVIAEAGSNHDRKLDQALALVDAAANAGCDAVKFQTFVGPDIAAGPGTLYTRVQPSFTKWGSELQDFYRACSLPREFHEPIAERARQRGIIFCSTAFSEWAVDLLCKIGVPALKIASFELGHLPLIRHAAATGLPLIVSTGLASLGDVERALDAAHKGNCKALALLHCGSNYPLSAPGANLAAMKTLRRAFRVPVGYSDHTLGLAVPTAAAALGAELLEKHFTIGRSGEGPDHSFALEPQELSTMLRHVREAQSAVGSSAKRAASEEADHSRGKRSLFAARDLVRGERLRADAVKIVRPGAGLEPFLLDIVLDRPLIRSVAADHPLTWDDFLQPK